MSLDLLDKPTTETVVDPSDSIDARRETYLNPSRMIVAEPRFTEYELSESDRREKDAEDVTFKVPSLLPPLRRVVEVGAVSNRPRKLSLLQQWEGVVSEISGDYFWADLKDLSGLSKNSEVVELPLSDISEKDKDILKVGSVFYWSIGYEKKEYGQITRISEIRVKRAPKWTTRMLDQAGEEAERLLTKLTGACKEASADAAKRKPTAGS